MPTSTLPPPPLRGFEFVDDGMYNNQWNIYDAHGRVYAQTPYEWAAREIFDAVNAARLKEVRDK
jgi:hypothetical protein